MRIWVIILVWILISCNDIRDCELPASRQGAVLAFYEADSVEKYRKDTLIFINNPDKPDTLSPSSTTGLTVGLLTLDPTDTFINYGFVTDSATYQLWLSYSKKVEIFYVECDPVFVYTLDSVYSPDFDSVVIINEHLDRQVPVNVEIYF